MDSYLLYFVLGVIFYLLLDLAQFCLENRILKRAVRKINDGKKLNKTDRWYLDQLCLLLSDNKSSKDD